MPLMFIDCQAPSLFLLSSIYIYLCESERELRVGKLTICQRVGRQQTQNMISFPIKIMTREWVPESLVQKLNTQLCVFIFNELNYLKVGGCLIYDSFVKNVYIIIRQGWQVAGCHEIYSCSCFGNFPYLSKPTPQYKNKDNMV